MNGVTSASVQVRAPGSWRLSVEPLGGSPDANIASRVSLSPSTGTGNAVVSLTVNPQGLASDPDHQFALRLEASGRTVTRSIVFSFPDVTGYAMRRVDALGGEGLEADQAATLPPSALGVVISAGSAEAGASGQAFSRADVQNQASAATQPADATLRSGPSEQPFSRSLLDAATSPAGTVTLIVGVERAGGTPLQTLGEQAATLGPDSAALRSLSTAVSHIAGATVQGRFDEASLALVEVPATDAENTLRQLRSTPGVRYAELPELIYPLANDEFRHLQWGMDTVGVEQLWPVADGTGITIAILDNGFYPDHPDLQGNIVGQYDAGDQKPTVRATRAECGTHGTHVAGIAAATANNGIGVIGAAPGAGLYLVDLDYETQPGCPMNAVSLVRALDHVVNGGTPLAHIINMSIGTANDLGQGVQDALQAAVNAGIILVGASGNTRCVGGQDTFVPVSYPAAYSQVWAVGATDKFNDRACYSHIGGELFVVAPGGDGFNPGGARDTILSTDHDFASGTHRYGWMEGTSMASPMVAGVVALLKSASPTATNADIRQSIIEGAQDLGAPGRDNLYGHGLIDAVAAYDALTGGAEPPPPPPPPPPVGRMRLIVVGYGTYDLHADGVFTLQNWPTGTVTVIVETDDNDNGVYGEPGEYRGQATVSVQFDAQQTLVVYLDEQE